MATINFRKNDTLRNLYTGIIQIKKKVTSVDELPEIGALLGDAYLVGPEGEEIIYVYSGDSWISLSSGDCPCTYPKVNLDADTGMPDVFGYQTLARAAEAGDWDKIVFSQSDSSEQGAEVTEEYRADSLRKSVSDGGLTDYVFLTPRDTVSISPLMSSNVLNVAAAIQQRLIDEAEGGDYIKLAPDSNGSFFTLADLENNVAKISIHYLNRNGKVISNGVVGNANSDVYFFTVTPIPDEASLMTVSGINGASMILDYTPFKLTEEEVNSLVGLTLMVEKLS